MALNYPFDYRVIDNFLDIKKEYNDKRILHFTSFRWDYLKEADGVSKILATLKSDFEAGARGVKLWKNFGLELKKPNGERLRLDDEVLEPLFQEIEKQEKIVSIHTADPEAFFSPIDETNERYEELIRHPEWSFNSEVFPKFQEIMDERDRMFKKYPKIKFVSRVLSILYSSSFILFNFCINLSCDCFLLSICFIF
jgi:hypothetical protein